MASWLPRIYLYTLVFAAVIGCESQSFEDSAISMGAQPPPPSGPMEPGLSRDGWSYSGVQPHDTTEWPGPARDASRVEAPEPSTVDACMFHPDHDVVIEQFLEIQAEALEISLECASQPHPQSCVALHLQEIFGVSHLCGVCFADHSICLVTSCLGQCAMEPQSSSCARAAAAGARRSAACTCSRCTGA